MRPILYPHNETSFASNGIGILSDAIECSVVSELNGQYELSMRYPTSGLHYDSIVSRAIILAKPDPVSDPQPFRIYRRVPSSQGTVMVYARHIAYDAMGITVSPFQASSLSAALTALKQNADTACPFTLLTDKSVASPMTVAAPSTLWSLLGGTKGSLLDVYGGEYEFDRWKINLWSRRGADRGVSIRYGKNLTSLEQDENIASCYTGVRPYWMGTDGTLVDLPEKIVAAPGTYDYTRIMPLDLSAEFETAPTEDALRQRTVKYIADNDIGTPAVSWKVEFVALEQTEEYKGKALLERVLLGDPVSVIFPRMNVNATARVVKTDFDPILERYNSVTLGRVKNNLATTIANQKKELDQKPGISLVQSIVMTITATILGAKGGAVRLLDTDGDEYPDTLYVADNPDPNLAVKVWRWNYEGWAGSKTGYAGPFIVAATLEDGLLATAVTAANLVAGTIRSADGESFFVDLNTGEVRIKAVKEVQSDVASAAASAAAAQSTANTAAQQARQAQQAAATAQEAADTAKADAQTAQETADTATAAAAAAQSEATTATAAAATAQEAADKAEADLEKAKADLATVTTRVGATEADIAQAQQAVTTAQTAADKAKADAKAASEKAQAAQETADTAVTNAAGARTAADAAAEKAAAAQEAADEAKTGAATAQNTANAAKTAAAAAQSTADTAKTNAAAAQAKADAAATDAATAQAAAEDADAKAAAAQADLNTAKENLAAVTGRVDATEEELTAAQAAVEAAQAAADTAKANAATAQSTANTAKANAATAQTAANNAKTAADNAQTAADAAKEAAEAAQADVDALAVRVTTAETGITQNAEQIALRATKTEVTQLLSGYSTTEQMQAAIDLQADSITSTVSSTYATKSALSATDTKAANAATAASTAQETADTAKANAATAQSTADTAKANAATAQSTANTAKTNAATAQSTADTAKTNAATAQTAANNAKTAADNAQADVDALSEHVTASEAELRDTISAQYTSIIQDCEGVILSALEAYARTSDLDEFRQTVSAQLQILADEISLKFTTATEQTDGVSGELKTFLNQFTKYIRFSGETAITVGSGDGAVTLEIDNETGIIFKKNGVQFGWWDGVDFHTGNIVVNVNERAQFGNFAFVPRSDGSLSFLKVGG